MALLLKRPTGFDPVPAGLHHATCIRIIDLGTQKSQFAGKVKIQPCGRKTGSHLSFPDAIPPA